MLGDAAASAEEETAVASRGWVDDGENADIQASAS
jgi:hypothetical protein